MYLETQGSFWITSNQQTFHIQTLITNKYLSRYCTDSRIIETKDFVERIYIQIKDQFSSKHEKRLKKIKGLGGLFSLKRLSEAIYFYTHLVFESSKVPGPYL